MLDHWGECQIKWLKDPNHGQVKPACCWDKVPKELVGEYSTEEEKEQQRNISEKQQRIRKQKSIYISRLKPHMVTDHVPDAKRYLVQVICLRMGTIIHTRGFRETIHEAKQCSPPIVADDLIENMVPAKLKGILRHHLMPADKKAKSEAKKARKGLSMKVHETFDVESHQDFIKLYQDIIPPAFCPYIDQETRVQIVEAAELRHKMRQEPFDEDFFKGHAHLIPRELAEVLTREETVLLVEKLDKMAKEDGWEKAEEEDQMEEEGEEGAGGGGGVADMDIDPSDDESLVVNEAIEAAAPLPQVPQLAKPQIRLNLVKPAAPVVAPKAAKPIDPSLPRFLPGMKVKVSDDAADASVKGVEGVLERRVKRNKCVLRVNAVTTVKVRTRDLEPVAPDIGEPCKLLTHDDCECNDDCQPVGRIVDFIDGDIEHALVEFDGDEAEAERIKLDDLCLIQL